MWDLVLGNEAWPYSLDVLPVEVLENLMIWGIRHNRRSDWDIGQPEEMLFGMDLMKNMVMQCCECVSFSSPSLQTSGLGRVSPLWSGVAVPGTFLASTPRCSAAVTQGVAGPLVRLQRCALSGGLVSATQRTSTCCFTNWWPCWYPRLDVENHQRKTQRKVTWGCCISCLGLIWRWAKWVQPRREFIPFLLPLHLSLASTIIDPWSQMRVSPGSRRPWGGTAL